MAQATAIGVVGDGGCGDCWGSDLRGAGALLSPACCVPRFHSEGSTPRILPVRAKCTQDCLTLDSEVPKFGAARKYKSSSLTANHLELARMTLLVGLASLAVFAHFFEYVEHIKMLDASIVRGPCCNLAAAGQIVQDSGIFFF